MSAAECAQPISAAEANALFQPLLASRAVVLAVSGGPDSTALLFLAARWRRARKRVPWLLAVTIDHGLRPQSAAEARAVKELAHRFDVPHRTVRWSGRKPRTGLQKAAREARYRLLAATARRAKASAIVTGHTLDDQAETVLMRMTRGSGMSGLIGMRTFTRLAPGPPPLCLVRPLLGIAKARLIATLERAKIGFANDPFNLDPRFARARMRELMPALAEEGLDARRLAQLARRIARADAAAESAVDRAEAELCEAEKGRGVIVLASEKFDRLPEEIGLRLLGRVIAAVGEEGPVELGKLENLFEGLKMASKLKSLRWRRTLAGALLTLTPACLTIETTPARKRPL